MAFGEERNTNQPNPSGTYKDPESGAELTVTQPAGADALVRMGWQPVGETAKAARGSKGRFLPKNSSPGPNPDNTK